MNDDQGVQKYADESTRHGGSGRYVRLILFILGLVIIGLALYIVFSPQSKPQTDLSNKEPDQARQVLSKAEMVIRNAQDIAVGDALRVESYRKARDLLWAYNQSSQGNIDIQILLADVSIKLCRLNAPDSAVLLSQANAALNNVLAKAPNSVRGLWLKGELARMSGGNFLEFFSRAADSPAADWQTWTDFAQELLRYGENDQARKYIERAAKSATGGAAARKLLLARAELAVADKQYQQAAEFFRQAVDLDSSDMHAWLMLARCTEKSADAAATLKVINKAIDTLHGKLKGELFYMKGTLLETSGEYEKAADTFIAATADPAVRSHAALEAAKCLYELKRFAPAMGYIDMAAKQLPMDDPKLHDLKTKIEDARFGKTN